MDYYPVSFWNPVKNQWTECGRFYRNALVIDYQLVDSTVLENVFRAPTPNYFKIDTWKDAPGSSKWPAFEDKNYPTAGLFKIKPEADFTFGVDLPFERNEGIRTIAYAGQFPWRDSSAANPLSEDLDIAGKLFTWKAWHRELKDIFEPFHGSINVKDISR